MSECERHPFVIRNDDDIYGGASVHNFSKGSCPYCQLAALQAENELLKQLLHNIIVQADADCTSLIYENIKAAKKALAGKEG
jgi:hypothetical protein